MPDAIKKLREPAALAAVAFVGLSLLGLLIGLLFPPSADGVSESFSDLSAQYSTQILSPVFAAAVAFAVYLANHGGGAALAKAKTITLIALIETGIAVVFGLVTLFAAFGVSGGGSSTFANFLVGLGGLAALAVALWYVWLTWQQHAPAPAAQPQPWGGYNPQQTGQYPGQPQQPGQYPGQPQPGQPQGQYPGQPQTGQQTPPPGGFGWTPQQPGGAPGQQAGDRTQLLPPVPSAPQGFAASPQPWNPAGPGGAPQLGQSQPGQQPQQPGQQPGAQGQQGQQQPGGGPFSVGDWRSDS